MEIIAEIVFQILGFILRIFGELLLQLLAEVFGELFIHSVKEPFRRPEPMHPVLAAIGYSVFGAAAGGLTVWMLPNFFLETHWLRILNIVATPFLAGVAMGAIGAWRRHRDKEVIRLESFAYGYCFALSMALVRFFFGA